jgi:hypothetical protein
MAEVEFACGVGRDVVRDHTSWNLFVASGEQSSLDISSACVLSHLTISCRGRFYRLSARWSMSSALILELVAKAATAQGSVGPISFEAADAATISGAKNLVECGVLISPLVELVVSFLTTIHD